jgi:hypothetical protein
MGTAAVLAIPCVVTFAMVLMTSLSVIGPSQVLRNLPVTASPAPGARAVAEWEPEEEAPSKTVLPPPTCPEAVLKQAEDRGPYFGSHGFSTGWRAFGSLTTHEAQCNNAFGFPLIEEWRSKGQVWCGDARGPPPTTIQDMFLTPLPDASSNSTSKAPLGDTRISCFKIRQFRHTGDDTICVGENFALDMSKILVPKKPPQILKFSRGAMKGTTAPLPAYWKADHFTMWQQNWFLSYEQTKLRCDVTIDEPTVLFARDNWKHLYWQMAAFFNLFVGYNMVGFEPDTTRVVLLDHWPKGPFIDIIQEAFSTLKYPVQSLADIAPGNSAASICFRRALIMPPEYSAAIVKGRPNGDDCAHSELVKAFGNHIASRLAAREDMNDKSNSRPVKIIINSRKDYDGRKLARTLANEDALVHILTKRHKNVAVEQVDFARLSFRDQIHKASTADIMIGVHGSGLAHCLFMPPEGIVMEITIPQGNLKTFRNLCKWAGKTYIGFPFTSGSRGAMNVDEKAFLHATDAAILVASSFYSRVVRSKAVTFG